MLQPGTSIPHTKTLSRIVSNYVEKFEKTLLREMPPMAMLSAAIDCLTSQYQQSFLTICDYFINASWQLQEVVLGFKPLYGQPLGENIGKIWCESYESMESKTASLRLRPTMPRTMARLQNLYESIVRTRPKVATYYAQPTSCGSDLERFCQLYDLHNETNARLRRGAMPWLDLSILNMLSAPSWIK